MSKLVKKLKNIPALPDESLDMLLRALQGMRAGGGDARQLIMEILAARSAKFETAGDENALRRRVPPALAACKASAARALARLGLRVDGEDVEIRNDHPAIVATVARIGAYGFDGARWEMLAYDDLAAGTSAWRTVLRLPGARVPAATTANPKITRVPAGVFLAVSPHAARAIATRFHSLKAKTKPSRPPVPI